MNDAVRSSPALASIIDRLVDRDPDAARDPPRSNSERLAAHRLAVLRDLSDLLNTRRAIRSLEAAHADLSPSTLHYGLDDPSATDLSSMKDRETFRRDVEATIRLYEPRFRRVSVHVLDADGPRTGPLRLRIEALLHAEPAPLAVTFDSVLDPSDGSFQVEDRGS